MIQALYMEVFWQIYIALVKPTRSTRVTSSNSGNLIDEKEILALLKDPRQRDVAFGHILDANQRRIYYFVRRMVLDHDDADDVTQNTFIKAWKGLDGFRGEAKISTWLHRIAYNEAITFIGQKKKRNHVSVEDHLAATASSLMADVLYEGDDIQARLHAAVDTLPEKQKAVFVMKYFEEKKYEEISDITGTSVGALKASFHHAVNKIEEFVKLNIESNHG